MNKNPLKIFLRLLAMIIIVGCFARAFAQGLPTQQQPTVEQVLFKVNQYCGACHKVPPPDILPKKHWPGVVQTMADLAREQLGREFIPVTELHHIKAYYFGSSPTTLPRLPYLDEQISPLKFKITALRSTMETPLVVSLAPSFKQGEFLIADAGEKAVLRLSRKKNTWIEQQLASFEVPIHTQVIDMDDDKDNDILVADLGQLPPSGAKVGKVYLLRQIAPDKFRRELIVENLGRVTDARALDLDKDGDLDIAISVFGGGSEGEILWLEKRGQNYHPHQLASLAGALNITPVDLNNDGLIDLVSLIAQEHEMVLALLNRGRRRFEAIPIAQAPHPMFGSTSLTAVDLDQDGDTDILFTNGDAFDLQTEPKPYHGLQWLENHGSMKFQFHDIARFYGVATATTGDLDGDGDLDIVASSWVNFWKDSRRHTLVWYENNGHQVFRAHPVASQPAGLVSLQLTDVTGDGRLDILAAAFRMDLWLEQLGYPGNAETRPVDTSSTAKPRLLLFENLPANTRIRN